jgi:hypothetical protein
MGSGWPDVKPFPVIQRPIEIDAITTVVSDDRFPLLYPFGQLIADGVPNA